MILFVILLLAIILTVFTIWKPNYIFAFISAAGWLAFLSLTRTSGLYGMVVGSAGDEFVVIICLAMAIAMPLTTFFRFRESNESIKAGKGRTSVLSSYREERETRHGTRGNFAESPEEYQARVRGILRHKKR